MEREPDDRLYRNWHSCVIIAAAAFYVYKAKKSGKKCIGCPDGCSCSSKKADQHHCCCGTHEK